MQSFQCLFQCKCHQCLTASSLNLSITVPNMHFQWIPANTITGKNQVSRKPLIKSVKGLRKSMLASVTDLLINTKLCHPLFETVMTSEKQRIFHP